MSKRPQPTGLPNYKKAIIAALIAGTLQPQPGQVTVLNIAHDDNCAFFSGGPCNCDPDIIQEKPV